MPTMREIVLKTVNMADGAGTLSYRDMLLTATKTPNNEGVDGPGMAVWLPIQIAIATAAAEEGQDPVALLTEEQFPKLVGAVNSFRGYVVCPENGAFLRDIKESKSVEVVPAATR